MNSRVNDLLFKRRFELLLLSYCLVLFGSLFFPVQIYHDLIGPLFLLMLALSGINLCRGHRLRPLLLGLLLIPVITLTILDAANIFPEHRMGIFAIYFIFFQIIAVELFQQIIRTSSVDFGLLMAAIGGMLALGILGAFGFMFLELLHHGSFSGVDTLDQQGMFDDMLYYSFISLLTIGYGDLIPVTDAARKSSIMLGVVGHVYTAIIMGIIIGKYLVDSTTLEAEPLEEE